MAYGGDLIVAGSHGATLAGDSLLGGAVFGIVHASRLPTFVVWLKADPGVPAVCANGTRKVVDHVLFPTDLFRQRGTCVSSCCEADRGRCPYITVTRVQDRARIEPHLHDRLDEFKRADRERVARIQRSLTQAGTCPVDMLLAFGRPPGPGGRPLCR